jgi:DNA gyrase inhibitor GyrI
MKKRSKYLAFMSVTEIRFISTNAADGSEKSTLNLSQSHPAQSGRELNRYDRSVVTPCDYELDRIFHYVFAVVEKEMWELYLKDAA